MHAVCLLHPPALLGGCNLRQRLVRRGWMEAATSRPPRCTSYRDPQPRCTCTAALEGRPKCSTCIICARIPGLVPFVGCCLRGMRSWRLLACRASMGERGVWDSLPVCTWTGSYAFSHASRGATSCCSAGAGPVASSSAPNPPSNPPLYHTGIPTQRRLGLLG